jgi:uncharacterized repeat protein (TIGR03803 family)
MKHLGIKHLMCAMLLLVAVTAASAQTYTNLFTYPGTDNNTSGITWPGVLSQGQDGLLYSTIQTNGAYNSGSVYKISTTGQYTLLYSFCAEKPPCATTGGIPTGGVTLGVDGNLWGTTTNGGKDAAGTAFKITPAGILTNLYSFTNGTDDSAPTFTLLQGQDGNMYGVSEEQYNTQYGSFFKLSPKGVITSHPFTYTDGATPDLPVQGTDLNFYGTTQSGGDPTCKCGVIYKATAAGKITVLHAFTGYPNDGNRPIGILVQGNDGNFYGTTYSGGANNDGTVFKISPAGAYTFLYSFGSAGDGSLPIAGLTLGTDGNFYGTTTGGGSNDGGHPGGTIYKITSAGKETVLYNFCAISCFDGLSPTTRLVQHTNGKFYGNSAGNSLGGSVFYSFAVGLKAFTKLEIWSAKVGATVGILGEGFSGATAVSFDGIPAQFKNTSDTYMTATVPAGALTGKLAVTTFTGSLKSDRSFLVVPQAKTFTPASGVVGTSVSITGVSLTQTSGLIIGGKPATFKVNSDTHITARVPAGALTDKTITITTPGGTASSAAEFVVAPLVKSFSPASGPVGTSVVITGNGFTKTTGITFGGVAATSFQTINDTQVDALVPTGAVTGALAVTTAGGTGNSTSNFTVTK